MEEQPFQWGDVYAFVNQEVIMLKAVTDEGDPRASSRTTRPRR